MQPRHEGHVNAQEKKLSSPLGTKLYFHVNSSRKNSILLTPNMAALSHGCKPRIGLPSCTISSMIITFSPCESLDPLQNSMMVKSTITLGILKLHDLIYSTNPRPKTNFLNHTYSASYSGETNPLEQSSLPCKKNTAGLEI